MPAMAVESGPAAGVVAAALVARQTGRGNLLSFDMGGTTAKASLIRDGQYETTPEYEVGGGASGSRWMHGTGHPIRVPVIDLAEVSAGGGSIAWVDRAGRAARRPEERRRRAGPGLLRPRRHRAHRHRLRPGARLSRQGLAARRRPADRPRGRGSRHPQATWPSRSAWMPARRPPPSSTSSTTPWREALKIVSVQRGHDPREFALAAFGGAGPLHAAALADELGIAEIVCPPIPGAFSALGLVGTDLKRDYVRTVYVTTASADPASARGRVRRAGARGRRHARPRRHRARAPSLRALRRCPLRAPVLRADRAGAAARARCAPSSPRSPRPSTPAIAPPTATTTAASRCSS